MSARTYWVGLPVGVTVHEDGGVSVEVDMSEAPSAISEVYNEADEDTYPEVAAYPFEGALLDMAIVEAHRGTFTVSHQRDTAEMTCPKWRCEFKTADIPEMLGHIGASHV